MVAHDDSAWPALPLAAWKDTYATLHMITQVVGKVRLALSPPVNHWWGVAFYLDARGMTTSAMPYGAGTVEIRFDFIDHAVIVETSGGGVGRVPLSPRPVAEFYREFLALLGELGIRVKIWSRPAEVPDPIPFEKDVQHAAYDAEYAQRCWRAMLSADTAFQEFRARFLGKSSPSHFFWGGFDLAVTRFNGRRSPEKIEDWLEREAYSHELISAGFWPGGSGVDGAAFYAYARPEPAGFAQRRMRPAQARYDPRLKQFLLMYDDVRAAASPKQAVLDFLQSTYEAAADLARWDRAALEKA
jgi:hypothetical protein